MSAGAVSDQAVIRHAGDEEPVRRDVALTLSRLLAGQSVIIMARGKRFLSQERADGVAELARVEAPLLHRLVVPAKLRPGRELEHQRSTFSARASKVEWADTPSSE